MVKAKRIRFGLKGEFRKAQINNDDLTLAELELMAQRIYKLAPTDSIKIKYIDEDDVMVTIGDDTELKLAMDDFELLKVLIYLNDDQEHEIGAKAAEETIKPEQKEKQSQTNESKIDNMREFDPLSQQQQHQQQQEQQQQQQNNQQQMPHQQQPQQQHPQQLPSQQQQTHQPISGSGPPSSASPGYPTSSQSLPQTQHHPPPPPPPVGMSMMSQQLPYQQQHQPPPPPIPSQQMNMSSSQQQLPPPPALNQQQQQQQQPPPPPPPQQHQQQPMSPPGHMHQQQPLSPPNHQHQLPPPPLQPPTQQPQQQFQGGPPTAPPPPGSAMNGQAQSPQQQQQGFQPPIPPQYMRHPSLGPPLQPPVHQGGYAPPPIGNYAQDGLKPNPYATKKRYPS